MRARIALLEGTLSDPSNARTLEAGRIISGRFLDQGGSLPVLSTATLTIISHINQQDAASQLERLINRCAAHVVLS